MTPKEKAEELAIRYYSLISGLDINFISKLSRLPSEDNYFGNARQCALIAVDELIDTVPSIDTMPPYMPITKRCKEYWNEVKQEIEKL